MLKAHYTLKCTSWLISPDLLRASVTPPTTAAYVGQGGGALVQQPRALVTEPHQRNLWPGDGRDRTLK